MRLHSIELKSDYKIFLAGQKFVFGNDNILGIVGVNGSGKSILLELISKIFVEASCQITRENYVSELDYEVTYSLLKDHMIDSVLVGIGGKWEDVVQVCVSIINKDNIFRMTISNGHEEFEISNINISYVFFPRKIVVYSSGHNEGVSDEIINYKLYSLVEKENQKIKKNSSGEIINKGILDRYNELFYYFDDTVSKFAILTAFLFKSSNQVVISQFLEMVLVKSFKIRLDSRNSYGNEIFFDEKATYLINEIFRLNHNNCGSDNGFECFEFLAASDEEREQMSLLAFFEGLQRLYDYNIYKIKSRKRKSIIYGSAHNKKSLIDWNIGNDKVFELLEITLKTDSGSELELRDFSDGEYQVLQLII